MFGKKGVLVLKIKIIKLFIYLCSKYRCFLYKHFFSTANLKEISCKLVQATQFMGRGNIKIDDASIGIFTSNGVLTNSSYIEARESTALVRIFPGTIINNNATIIAKASKIIIGEKCLIGSNFFCINSDFHSIDPIKRLHDDLDVVSVDVIVGNNVFIGDGVKVLKGSKIGNNSVIAAGSIVSGVFPDNSLIAGVPARKIKNLLGKED